MCPRTAHRPTGPHLNIPPSHRPTHPSGSAYPPKHRWNLNHDATARGDPNAGPNGTGGSNIEGYEIAQGAALKKMRPGDGGWVVVVVVVVVARWWWCHG